MYFASASARLTTLTGHTLSAPSQLLSMPSSQVSSTYGLIVGSASSQSPASSVYPVVSATNWQTSHAAALSPAPSPSASRHTVVSVSSTSSYSPSQSSSK